ncbi:neprosin family prolyl endopeptidase, partial [Kitasatospora nipponensis]|uniref:neprosin family prolyl endopeptidase n=1 Tax=Kitasatospora nipponensis TaxID=258049 RepID=UPI0031DD3D84
MLLTRGSGTNHQTIEVGCQEYHDLNGDWLPHLFVFFTTNNYTKHGKRLGGYNQNVEGWVQVADTIHPGALLSRTSELDGPQRILRLKVQLWEGNWWVKVKDTWIGFYPADLFSTDGLRSEAAAVKWYGEVADSKADSVTTRTDMGNGHGPYEGWQRCAYMHSPRYQSSPRGTMT